MSDGHLGLVIILALLMSLPLNITAAGQFRYAGSQIHFSFHYSRPTNRYWLFKLTLRPSRALDLPRGWLPELQGCKDTFRWAALGAVVTGHHQKQLTQTLIVRLLKTHFFTHQSLIVKKSTE